MKYTGWAVLLIGLLIGLYGVLVWASIAPGMMPPAADPSESNPANTSYALSTVLFVFSGLAVTAGVLLLAVGGRGVIKTKNLAVRN